MNQNPASQFGDNEEIDSFHIPHIGILQWHARNENMITASKDLNKRNFGVRFYLEDLRAGTGWTYVQMKNEMSLVIEKNGDMINIFFEKNEGGFLSSVLVEIIEINPIKAFKEASQHIFSLLSTLCFFYRRPFHIKQITVIDPKYDAYLDTRKFCPKAEIFLRPIGSFKNNPIGSLFAIYGEGMNSIDIPYRYICFFKIYEAWHEHPEKFFYPPDNTKKEKTKIILTKNMLANSYRDKFHSSFINKTFCDNDLYKELNKIRKYLVHPIINRGVPASFCNLDAREHLEAIEAMSNLVERIATKILDIELKTIATIDPDIARLWVYYTQLREKA